MGEDRLSRELGPSEVPEDANESLPLAEPPARDGLPTPNPLLGVRRIDQECSKKYRLLHVKGLECLRIRHADVDHRESNRHGTLLPQRSWFTHIASVRLLCT